MFFIEIVTKIVSSIPDHLLVDAISGKSEPLNIFIKRLIDAVNSSGTSTPNAIEMVVNVSFKTGDVLNISGLIS